MAPPVHPSTASAASLSPASPAAEPIVDSAHGGDAGPTLKSKVWLIAACLAAAAGTMLAAGAFWVNQSPLWSAAAALTALALCLAAVGLLVPRMASLAAAGKVRFPWTSPLTGQGILFIAAILVVACAAIYSGNNLLYLVLSAMLAAALISGLASRLDLAGLELRLTLPDHLFAGAPTLATIRLRNLKRLQPSVAVRVSAGRRKTAFEIEDVYFPLVGAGESLTAMAQARFSRRGLHRRQAVTLETRFPFGLVTRRAVLRLADEIIAYPSIELSAHAIEILQRLERSESGRTRGESQDLYRIRPAVPDDGARFIHWKSAARGEGLWVREFTREDSRRVRLTLDRHCSGDAPSRERFEQTVNDCAAVCWALHQSAADVTLVSDQETIHAGPADAGIFEILRYLAVVEPSAHEPDSTAGPPPAPDQSEYRFATPGS